MADHNLTPVLAKCLDRHLVFPLLEFLSQKQLFDGADIQRAKIDLLQKTNMVDYAMDIYKELYNKEAPADMRERRGEVVSNLKTLQARPKTQCSLLHFTVKAWRVKLLCCRVAFLHHVPSCSGTGLVCD